MPKSKEFISSSESDSDEPKPKKKKRKETEVKEKSESSQSADKKVTKGANGEQMFQLSKMRFVSVSEFRGKVLVGIREYYEADGDLRPGKKGISLSLEQWNNLKDQMEEIDRAVKGV
ncbi:activated RNA polymerase II transcriptional coactivator p15-like [Ylistrum balloti]|uniref:activated RNA polymerase II transcriptional coactivator p15-like n=1 Tax=Ylistrum balloti TaxID=509963 RepID=UPI002905CBDF|nr:activated RNA polymerase II transcriptional coactivator p15-like [Ylistrum balloti]XP_060066534.1 activated RNA polymerase II transcriptional coactivator p15-like [Ylistrum balloti]XP_060066535.1 activated RNA polymerase II transcriptional coactivator p15-like [Ylistrum balloti]XP_060066538.1 activated RNA polymerase II transcriptional coactivator p15-like [Ylistrum balloti]